MQDVSQNLSCPLHNTHPPTAPSPPGTGRIPDTGSLRDDALTIMRRASRRISDIGPATVVGLLNDLMADDSSDTIIDQLARGGGEVMNQALARAATRGEAREHVPERVARLPLDLIRHELILTHGPPSNETLEEILDQIFLPLVMPTRDPHQTMA
jgi:hypothetical protein